MHYKIVGRDENYDILRDEDGKFFRHCDCATYLVENATGYKHELNEGDFIGHPHPDSAHNTGKVVVYG